MWILRPSRAHLQRIRQARPPRTGSAPLGAVHLLRPALVEVPLCPADHTPDQKRLSHLCCRLGSLGLAGRRTSARTGTELGIAPLEQRHATKASLAHRSHHIAECSEIDRLLRPRIRDARAKAFVDLGRRARDQGADRRRRRRPDRRRRAGHQPGSHRHEGEPGPRPRRSSDGVAVYLDAELPPVDFDAADRASRCGWTGCAEPDQGRSFGASALLAVPHLPWQATVDQHTRLHGGTRVAHH